MLKELIPYTERAEKLKNHSYQFKLWCEYISNEGKGKAKSYSNHMIMFLENCDKPIKDIYESDINKYLNEKNLADNTKNIFLLL